MARFRSGWFYSETLKYHCKFSCTECEYNTKLPEIWGCHKNTLLPEPTVVIDYGKVSYDIMACPRQFVPKQVFEFLNIYDDLKYLPGIRLPDYDRMSNRFLESLRFFESEKIKCENELHYRRMKEIG